MKQTGKFLFIFSILILVSKLSFAMPIYASGDIKIIHGEDDRLDTFEVQGTMWENLSRSVAMQITDFYIMRIDDEFSRLIGGSHGDQARLCPGERFAEQTVVGRCSGFLVGDQYLVTAGHCVKTEFDCKYRAWVFDFELDHADDTDYQVVRNENTYNCSEVISSHYQPDPRFKDSLDFALIKLDRKVAGRTPLRLRKSGKIETDTPIAVIGHPDGLPKKIAEGARVIENPEGHMFFANLDTFHANSGSPVFNGTTGLVEGILVRGDRDYILDEELHCNRVNVIENECIDGSCFFEGVTRITVVEKLVETILRN